MNEEQLKQLMEKLDILIKLTSRNIVEGKSLKEQVVILHSLGISLKDIAAIVNKKPTDIGQYLYRKKEINKSKSIKK